MPEEIESGSTAPVATHFSVTASEMLFDTPEPCPAFGGLVWHGVAATESGDHHLILSVQHSDRHVRLYLGPDPAIVARRGLIVLAALRSSDALTLAEEAAVLFWLADCWTTFHATLLGEYQAVAAGGRTGGSEEGERES